jgi:hypothetical protein
LRKKSCKTGKFSQEILSSASYSITWRENAFYVAAKTIFCSGPCYDGLLERKISAEDQKKLNQIYYARIGIREHQYQRANKLNRIYVTSKLPACGT